MYLLAKREHIFNKEEIMGSSSKISMKALSAPIAVRVYRIRHETLLIVFITVYYAPHEPFAAACRRGCDPANDAKLEQPCAVPPLGSSCAPVAV